DSHWQVYDVLIDGVSFVSTYRSQFDRVIQAEAYGALVERLRKRNLDTAVVDRKKLSPPKRGCWAGDRVGGSLDYASTLSARSGRPDGTGFAPRGYGFRGSPPGPRPGTPAVHHTPRRLSAIVLASIVILGTAGTMALAFSRAAGGWDRGD